MLHARLPENGGWSPAVIQAEVNRPLRLRLTSDDVMHGFAIGQQSMPEVDVLPGQVTEVVLNFEKPGTYTFYCTRWCGPNHWRMRGTIEVRAGGSLPDPEPAPPPLYVSLGLDLDAPHAIPFPPATRPSAAKGAPLAKTFHLSLSPEEYRAHSPYQIFEQLASLPLSPAERWDVVAYLWQSNTSPQTLSEGARLYARNCAACHGESGAGDGVFAQAFTSPVSPSFSSEGMQQVPTAFTDLSSMLGASPALLQGKILRGGMGTGMPAWGPLLTPEQTWALVDYLYTFPFEFQGVPK
ncbi:MAG: c-type cytochrome [Anaerolineales bacterium]